MLIDTHCHLHFDAFDSDRDPVIERALKAGVTKMVNVGTDPKTNQQALELAQKYPFMVFTAGLHPHHTHEVSEEELKGVERFIKEKKPAAIGEIGLDYLKSEASADLQKKVFRRMLGCALGHNLPVIIHSRNAFSETLEILKSETGGKIPGVMHCFSYGQEELKKILDFGFLVSFTANITFKSATTLLDTAASAPLERIMLETDSPYLAPQSLRGRRNEPANLVETAQTLAKKREVSLEKLHQVTTQTATNFFKLPA